jgi:hypothetical protein
MIYDEKLRAPDLAPCEGCGAHHGSVGAHIACLNGHVRFLRGRLASEKMISDANAVQAGIRR